MQDNFILTLFGATGDLARKKILPSIFSLSTKGWLPPNWHVILFVRKHWTPEECKSFILEIIPNADDDFISHFETFEGDLEDLSSFTKLKERLQPEIAEKLFYLSISPALYEKTIEHIRDAKLMDQSSKILTEKPFGRSAEEALRLNMLLQSFVSETQVYRIDHYLAKSAMGEIDSYNFPTSKIERVEARFIESSVVGKRGVSYDSAGAFIDVGQNHLLAMVGATLCRVSGGHHCDRAEVLKPLSFKGGAKRGQYEGYLKEAGVPEGSLTETYFRAELQSSDPDFKDVSLLLEGGKGFESPEVGIKIFYETGEEIPFDFSKTAEGDLDPHGKLLVAVLNNDQTLFVSKEEVMEEWRIAEEVLAALRDRELQVYPRGTRREEMNH